jgi:HAD superfamily hydrolase (TIGR01509 family)
MPFNLNDVDFDAIIFDCDGTIADNMPLHFEAWAYSLKINGAKFSLTKKMILDNAGKGIREIVQIFNKQFSDTLVPEEVAAEKDKYFDTHRHKIKLIPEIAKVIETYRGKCPMAVASGSRTSSVNRTLDGLGIRDWFDPIVTVDDVARGKPAPDMFLLAAEKMGVAPERCVVFEDGDLGIQAAASCNMPYFRVRSRL